MTTWVWGKDVVLIALIFILNYCSVFIQSLSLFFSRTPEDDLRSSSSEEENSFWQLDIRAVVDLKFFFI